LAEQAAKRSEFPSERFTDVSRPRTALVPWALVLILGVAILARLWLARKIPGPWIMTDELFYSELAKSFAASGDFLIRDYPTSLFTLYSVLISPAWAFDSTGTAYALTKSINVLLMTTAAVPVFFWARRLTSPRHAILATSLVLAMPAFIYTGMVMTENAFFPAFVLSMFVLALVLERPTLLRQALMFCAFVLACLVRVQAVVLFAMLPVAIVIKVFFELRADGTALRFRPFAAELRRYWISLGVLLALALGYLAVQVARSSSLATGLGAYRITGETHYSPSVASRWFLTHLGELGYSVGIIPVSALIVCLALAGRWKADSTPAERAFLAVAVSSLLLVAQVAIYASRFADRIEERNMFHAAPLLFIALVLWLYRGLPRPAGVTAVAVLVPAALLVAIPFDRLFNVSLYSDSFALIPLLRLTQRLAGGAEDVRGLLAVGLVAAGVLFALVPRRVAAVLVPACVIGFLVVSSAATFRGVRFLAVGTRASAPADAAWVDHAIGTKPRAAFLYTPEIGPNPHILWQSEFWNRSVGPIYQVQTDAPGNPGSAATADRGTGRIVVPDPRGSFPPEFVVSDADVGVVGRVVARAGTLALTRVRPPLRITARTEGLYGDGWMGGDAAFNYYASPNGGRPRAVTVSVSRAAWNGPDVPGVVRVRVGRVEQRWVIHSQLAKTFVLPAPRPPFRARVHISPTFSPAEFGRGDPRQLGAQVSFGVVPRTP
jgi:hypothetical protein